MEKTNYLGIDYGRGQTNIDHDTQIRFGVIPLHEVIQAWCDSAEGVYVYFCPECDGELEDPCVENCPYCGHELNEMDFDFVDPVCFKYESVGYRCFQSHDDNDIFIELSPYYTLCQYCSPCAPGAGYIMNQVENGIKAYCFGPDWFDDEKAPYDIYDAKTGKLIYKAN